VHATTDFARQVVKNDETFVICNSVGGCAGLQAALVGNDNSNDKLIKGVVLFNISLRMLHTSKQPALMRPLITALQYVSNCVTYLFINHTVHCKAYIYMPGSYTTKCMHRVKLQV
jgi:hypothetical protein